MNKPPLEVGAFLRHWRVNRGVKLTTVAYDLGVATATWDHWETGRRRPSIDNLIAIADYLDIPPQCLLCAKNGRCAEEGETRLCER